MLGTPLLGKATLTFPDGKQTVIRADGPGCYVKSMTVDGRTYTPTYITRDMLTRGADIKIVKGTEPDTRRGTKPSDAPYSFSRDKLSR